MSIELINNKKKQPFWHAACNCVVFFLHNGYYCDGGTISKNDEMKQCWNNRTEVLKYVESLRQKGIEKVSVPDICKELKLTKEFVTFVLENEFGELEEE
uniref:Uncharacterized protein n=1 Tax=viral metagenome TaxID=1070528 RepID=A0A6M3XF96_9ZZZZ